MGEKDPRDSGYRTLALGLVAVGFEFEYREPLLDRPHGIDPWKDRYAHADGRRASVFQADTGEYCSLIELRGTEH